MILVNWIAPIPQLLSSDTLRYLESSKCNLIGIDVRQINHRCSLIRRADGSTMRCNHPPSLINFAHLMINHPKQRLLNPNLRDICWSCPQAISCPCRRPVQIGDPQSSGRRELERQHPAEDHLGRLGRRHRRQVSAVDLHRRL